MSDLVATLADAASAPDSTVLDAGSVSSSGGGQMPAHEEFNNTIKSALEQVTAEPEPAAKEAAPKEPAAKDETQVEPDAKVEAKAEEPKDEAPAPKEKTARGADGKFASAPKEEAPAETTEPKEQADDKQVIPAPARLLPDAQEKWKSTPRSVQRDIAQWMQEAETEREQFRTQTERYESIRPFDELARSNGRDLRESLVKLNHVENLLQSNPLAGLNEILREIGPRKADGSPYSLYEVAEHVINQGQQGYQQTIAQAQQQTRAQAEAGQVQQLQQEVQQLRAQQVITDTQLQVIEPFKAQHPRYDELRDEIALQIQTLRMHPTYGSQFQGLSPIDQLSMAYERAERIIPPSSPDASRTVSDPDPATRVEPDFSGRKSIRTGPGAVSPVEDVPGSKSLDDVLLDSLRKTRRA